jgi:outer membrane protein W
MKKSSLMLGHATQVALIAAVVALSCLCTTVARAERHTGFEAALRLGYGIPLGDAAGNAELSDGIAGQVPLILDIGYRITPMVFLGVYGQYGFAWLSDNYADGCDATNASCSAHDIRLGIEAQFHFQPLEKLDPWIGVGIGYEWAGLDVEVGNMEVDTTLSGFEFINLQAGLDIRVSEHFYVGPFLNFSIGQYSSASASCSGGGLCADQFGVNGDIDDKAVHEWLMLGVRAGFGP